MSDRGQPFKIVEGGAFDVYFYKHVHGCTLLAAFYPGASDAFVTARVDSREADAIAAVWLSSDPVAVMVACKVLAP